MDSAVVHEWIAANLPRTAKECLGQCRQMSEKVREQFPELELVRGHVCYMPWTEEDAIRYPHGWAHWWLTNGEEIIDPSLPQFCDVVVMQYVPWEGEIPTGKCPNCGAYCYNGSYLCSTACETSFEKWLRNGD